MPNDKPFQAVYDQIRLLKKRGLIFDDIQETKIHLLDKNYFDLINGFETVLLDDPINPPKRYTNVSFNDFLHLYDLDKRLSSLIFHKISELESKLKTSIAYHFCKNHCSSLADNNNYIAEDSYNKDDPNFSGHKILRNNYIFIGNFDGYFTGKIKFTNNNYKVILKGTFEGKFGSTTIDKVEHGEYTFVKPKDPSLYSLISSIATNNGNTINPIQLNFDGKIKGLNYIQNCKTQFPFINEYHNPPFWVVIKALSFNELIRLLHGFKKRTLLDILNHFDFRINDKDMFINSLEIIKDLRNTCAHFGLVNLFTTSSNLRINNRLITRLNLNPTRKNYELKLYDVLRVLEVYVDTKEIRMQIYKYCIEENRTISNKLLKEMGNPKIDDWVKN